MKSGKSQNIFEFDSLNVLLIFLLNLKELFMFEFT
jgi:hypothetical protein